jgi:hypothetical protein
MALIDGSVGPPHPGLDGCQVAVRAVDPIPKYVLLAVVAHHGAPETGSSPAPSFSGVTGEFGLELWIRRVGGRSFEGVQVVPLVFFEVQVGLEVDAMGIGSVLHEPILDGLRFGVVFDKFLLVEVGGEMSHFVGNSYILFLCQLDLLFNEWR